MCGSTTRCEGGVRTHHHPHQVVDLPPGGSRSGGYDPQPERSRQSLKATAHKPPITGAVGSTLRTDVRVTDEVTQRSRVAELGLPQRVEQRVVLTLGNRLARVAIVLGFAAHGDVIGIQARIKSAFSGDGSPRVAWFEDAIAPGAVARVNPTFQLSVKSNAVVRREIRRAAQPLGDSSRLAA